MVGNFLVARASRPWKARMGETPVTSMHMGGTPMLQRSKNALILLANRQFQPIMRLFGSVAGWAKLGSSGSVSAVKAIGND